MFNYLQFADHEYPDLIQMDWGEDDGTVYNIGDEIKWKDDLVPTVSLGKIVITGIRNGLEDKRDFSGHEFYEITISNNIVTECKRVSSERYEEIYKDQLEYYKKRGVFT
jgi:hypothetical protein